MVLSYYHAKFHLKRTSRFLQKSESVLGGPLPAGTLIANRNNKFFYCFHFYANSTINTRNLKLKKKN